MDSKESILIVDDDEMNRFILGNIFQDEFSIIQAENGEQGLKLIQDLGETLSAVLMDVVMPRMNGLEVLRCMAQKGIGQGIPLFLITSDTEVETMQEAYELGVMDYITKPVIPYVVRKRVDSVVELFRARKRLNAQVERQKDQLLAQAQQMAAYGVGMVESLATAIEFRSDESGEHVRRIHDITCILLRNTPLGAGFTEKEIDLIGVASITHDVGKISVPDAILNKPGRLTPEEMDIMRQHTVNGAELLSRIPQMREFGIFQYAYDIALHHHERWDGGGYPHGLKGEQIPIWTQIVSIADVYDALVSKRCYKSEYPASVAMEMILDGQCGVFNPELLKYFQEVQPLLQKLYQ